MSSWISILKRLRLSDFSFLFFFIFSAEKTEAMTILWSCYDLDNLQNYFPFVSCPVASLKNGYYVIF